MRREQRGPLGSNESQNPILWGLAIGLEAVEFEVVVQVFVGAIAAVGTLAQPRRNPKKDSEADSKRPGLPTKNEAFGALYAT